MLMHCFVRGNEQTSKARVFGKKKFSFVPALRLYIKTKLNNGGMLYVIFFFPLDHLFIAALHGIELHANVLLCGLFVQ